MIKLIHHGTSSLLVWIVADELSALTLVTTITTFLRQFFSIHQPGPADLAERLDLVALPGVQNKVSSAMLTAAIRNASGHYIIKFDPPSYQHLVQNEFMHLVAAATLRTPTAKAELIHDSTGRPALMVHRFDRARKGKTVTRLAQEDATRILNIPPANSIG